MSRGPHPYLTDDERAIRKSARLAVRKAVRDGTLTKTPCVVCSSPNVHGHHANGYNHPLDVEWLCASHHGYRHIEEQRRRMGVQHMEGAA